MNPTNRLITFLGAAASPEIRDVVIIGIIIRLIMRRNSSPGNARYIMFLFCCKVGILMIVVTRAVLFMWTVKAKSGFTFRINTPMKVPVMTAAQIKNMSRLCRSYFFSLLCLLSPPDSSTPDMIELEVSILCAIRNSLLPTELSLLKVHIFRYSKCTLQFCGENHSH